MLNRLKNKVTNLIEHFIFFKPFSQVLRKYDIDFYFKDELGILSKRNYNDNFEYIFKTKYSCDAMPMMIALSPLIKNSHVCIDVGSNIGITSIWMAKNSEQVYSFEPEKENMLRFVENVQVNAVKNIELIPKAISNKNGHAELNILESYGHHSLGKVTTSKFIRTEIVETTTLDLFCKENDISRIDFLKVDVEGFELEVFEGAKNLLKKKQINLIAFEVSKVILDELDKSFESILELFNNLDYSVYDLKKQIITPENCHELNQEDVMALPNFLNQ